MIEVVSEVVGIVVILFAVVIAAAIEVQVLIAILTGAVEAELVGSSNTKQKTGLHGYAITQ